MSLKSKSSEEGGGQVKGPWLERNGSTVGRTCYEEAWHQLMNGKMGLYLTISTQHYVSCESTKFPNPSQSYPILKPQILFYFYEIGYHKTK